MPASSPPAFISYSREDSEFALRLAQDLKAAGAHVWLDQLDILPGRPWDNAIEDALSDALQMLIVLSPSSAKSDNVRNEISYALEQGKIIVPVLYKDCIVPLRLQRTQRIDFRSDYARGLAHLLDHLRVAQPDPAVLERAAEGDAQRQAAWQAREVEAQRLREMQERQQREEAEREDAEFRAREAERFRAQAAEREQAERAARIAEAVRLQDEQHQAEKRATEERRAKEDAERQAREQQEAVRKAREAEALRLKESQAAGLRETQAKNALLEAPAIAAKPASWRRRVASILFGSRSRTIRTCAIACALIIAVTGYIMWQRGAPSRYVNQLQQQCDSGGDSMACVTLANSNDMGIGVPKNAGRAAVLYQEACNQGQSLGCRFSAQQYEDGDGVNQDPNLATGFYQKACNLGDQDSCNRLKLQSSGQSPPSSGTSPPDSTSSVPAVAPSIDPASTVPTINLAGTTWNGTDSDTPKYTYTFQAGGILRYEDPASAANGTWSQNGSTVQIQVNNYSFDTAHISGTHMEGTGHNTAGKTWTWTADLK